MSINAVITLSGDCEAGVYLHTHSKVGLVAGFIEEARTRFKDDDVIISKYEAGDSIKEAECRMSFYATLFGVVREYLAYYSAKPNKRVTTVMMYPSGITTAPLVYETTPVIQVNNDFSCDYIDDLIFSDSDIADLHKVRAFFERSNEAMANASKNHHINERKKKGYFHG